MFRAVRLDWSLSSAVARVSNCRASVEAGPVPELSDGSIQGGIARVVDARQEEGGVG